MKKTGKRAFSINGGSGADAEYFGYPRVKIHDGQTKTDKPLKYGERLCQVFW